MLDRPVVHGGAIGEVPECQSDSYRPQAQFGVYLPDTFWYGP